MPTTDETPTTRILRTSSMYVPSSTDGGVNVTAVLVAGAAGDYAAYVGHGEIGWISEYGRKLTWSEAVGWFPHGMVAQRYRD